MGGIYSLWGAVVAGLLIKLPARAARQLGPAARPAHDPLRRRGAPGADSPRRPASSTSSRRTWRGSDASSGDLSAARVAGSRDGGVGMIKVENLEVRFGGVKPIDRMTVTFPGGHLRPDRAERRRQDHLLQRPQRVRQAGSGGAVTAFGENLLAMPDFRRARWGLRRTFQTEQAIEELSALRQRRDGRTSTPSATAARPGARTCSVRSASSGSEAWTRTRRSARSARASGDWSRSPARSSASRASCCSTSPPPGSPTRRPSTWAA